MLHHNIITRANVTPQHYYTCKCYTTTLLHVQMLHHNIITRANVTPQHYYTCKCYTTTLLHVQMLHHNIITRANVTPQHYYTCKCIGFLLCVCAAYLTNSRQALFTCTHRKDFEVRGCRERL